jgi:hypothetical protein
VARTLDLRIERLNPLEVLNPPSTDAELLGVARRQVAHLRAKHPVIGVGGHLLVAELTREQIGTRVVGAL